MLPFLCHPSRKIRLHNQAHPLLFPRLFFLPCFPKPLKPAVLMCNSIFCTVQCSVSSYKGIKLAIDHLTRWLLDCLRPSLARLRHPVPRERPRFTTLPTLGCVTVCSRQRSILARLGTQSGVQFIPRLQDHFRDSPNDRGSVSHRTKLSVPPSRVPILPPLLTEFCWIHPGMTRS